MESHLSEESLWASGLAARLKILQANFADDDSSTRHDFIVQEIENALKGVVPEKRKRLLDALAERFPNGDGSAPVTLAPPANADSEPETPEASFERVLAILPSLSNEQRAAFKEKLKAAGLVQEKSGGGGSIEITPEIQKRLALTGAPIFNPDRASKTLALLLDMVLTMDQLAWTLWKQLAPKSTFKRESDLTKLSADYLVGSVDVSTPQMTQTLERTRKIVAGLLGAVGRAGNTFARERARLFDPNAIEADARGEKKWNESLEFACWRKYVQLCKEYGAEPVIEKGIQEAMAKAAENLLLGRPAS
jgi:hypothetical protein